MSTQHEVASEDVISLKMHARGVTAVWISDGFERTTEYEGTLSEVVPELVKDQSGCRWRVERAGNGVVLAESLIAHGVEGVELVDCAEVHFNGDGCCGVVARAGGNEYQRGAGCEREELQANPKANLVLEFEGAGEVSPDLQLHLGVDHPSMFLRKRIAELEQDKVNLQRLVHMLQVR